MVAIKVLAATLLLGSAAEAGSYGSRYDCGVGTNPRCTVVPGSSLRQIGVVPRGYSRAWDDGRLNPHRGPRTAAGDASMYLIWTDDVPMELKTRKD